MPLFHLAQDRLGLQAACRQRGREDLNNVVAREERLQLCGFQSGL